MNRLQRTTCVSTPVRAASRDSRGRRGRRTAGAVPAPARRRGYSFPEVLFAVIVLGIGFIMIAAVFPVAIQQSKVTADETVAATAARAGVATVTALGRQAHPTIQFKMLPVTGTSTLTRGQVSPIASRTGSEASWAMIRGDLVFAQDPRYAYVPLYRRDGDPANTTTWGDTAQIYIVTVQCRSTLRPANTTVSINGNNVTVPVRIEPRFDIYDYGVDLDTSATPFTNFNNLAPRRVKIKDLKDNPNGDPLDLVTFDLANPKADEPNQNLPRAVAQGCYLILEQTGQIYRVGAPRDEANGLWELIPGSDLNDNTEEVSNTDGFVIGREWHAPYGPDNFIGSAQDISIFTTYIPVAK